MRRTILAAVLLATGLSGETWDADGQRWWGHVEVLADDRMEGRNTGSAGHRKAAEYVASEWERAKLKPGGTQSYFQPVRFVARRLLEEQSRLELVGPDGNVQRLNLGEHANLSVRGEPAPQLEAGAVFVGYGLQIPEAGHDDLTGLDLKGKIAVYFSAAPPNVPGPLAAHYQSAERFRRLREAGAIGLAGFSDPANTDVPWSRATLARFMPSVSFADPAMNESRGLNLSININAAHADLWFAGTGHTAAEIIALAAAGKPLPKFPLNVKVRSTVKWDSSEIVSDNVIGIMEGSDPKLRNEYVVLSAHLDHVGVGRPINGDAIYNGAMDNASGIATLIELARALSAAPRPPKRSILFAAVTGEEKGLLGSKFFARNPTVKAESIVANLNMDMYLPLFPLKSLVVYGLDESDLGDLSREVGRELDIQIVADREPKRNIFTRSDQYNFIRQGVPALSFKFDAEPGTPEEQMMKDWIKVRYHAPSDDVKQPVDRPAAARFNAFILRMTERIADSPDRPRWKQTSFFRRFATVQP